MGETEVSDLSDQEEKALIILQLCAAGLSLIGSSTIVFKILRNLCTTKTTTPYDRIILGLSSCDIVSSITYGIGPFLLPAETSQRIWAFGNERTCQGLGFLMQLSCIWAIWYNCILSFYYLLTVRFRVKREVFCRKYELWMHLSGILFFPITSVTGYYARWYGEQALTMTCWVRFGDNAELVSYVYAGIPLAVTYLSLIINNIVIYVYLRKSLLTAPLQSKYFTTTSDDEDVECNENDSSHLSVVETEDFVSLAMVQRQLTKEAATQGLLYVVSFLLTATPVFVLQVLDGSFAFEEDDQGRIYPLLVMNAMLMPLQGFFNVFIYVRPTYSRFRAANVDKSRWNVFKQALFDPNIPKMTSAARGSSSAMSGARAIRPISLSKEKLGSNFSMSLVNIKEEEQGEC